ncbi:unnamed protein product [Bemisia tabaci]|uniref:ABC transporter domain-containing protein n=1 Tax=Bemisia tabaci TaxID=7038 RepID=A0A9P0AH18_BEMTA|nr:PREDICTED: ATP-binding cassette sub-family G member 5 [Bemisia tabaci]CAH0391652.1 unnamed protein product [Bemisia tabaci]
MVAPDYCLELCNIFHTGQVESASCLQRLFGNVQTGLILKDVSLEVRAGEVLAILGSKGSGKRALLEVISRRSSGPTRGQILLDGAPLTLSLFQRSCSYVSPRNDLIPSLTVEQTLYYASHLTLGSQASQYIRTSRIRQVMADLALSQVAKRTVAQLTPSEHRRLIIGIQMIKDPLVMLLDEPTVGLDPLSTYLIVSMLSSHARRRGRAVILTMEKPRSDVFPFLDRAAYLCLGDLVYAGPTRLMLEYFRAIGFPCPELENPLMYYLCLSTVDRRSRERFIESNTQIITLVEKFKTGGGPYRKSSSGSHHNHLLHSHSRDSMATLPMPLPSMSQKMAAPIYSRPSSLHVGFVLYQRLFASTFNMSSFALGHFFMRLLALPLLFSILWCFYHKSQNYHWTFMTKSGLVFNCIFITYLLSILTTASTFTVFRTRYYQEAQEGLYSGPLFLISHMLYSLPLSLISLAGATYIIFPVTGLHEPDLMCLFGAILWGCYLFAEQQTIALLMVVKSSFVATVSSAYIMVICLIIGSGILRSYRGLSEWLLYLSYGTQVRYASPYLNRQIFGDGHLSILNPIGNCSTSESFNEKFVCHFQDGDSYLAERFSHESGIVSKSDFLDLEMNLIITYIFPLTLAVLNCLLYLIPLPAFVKAKFRE